MIPFEIDFDHLRNCSPDRLSGHLKAVRFYRSPTTPSSVVVESAVSLHARAVHRIPL